MKYNGSAFMVHCIYGTIIDESLAYLIVSPDEGGLRFAKVFKNNVGGQYIGIEAVFIGEKTSTIGTGVNALIAYEVYWIGGVDSAYEAVVDSDDQTHDLYTRTYFVAPIQEDQTSCLRSERFTQEI